MRSIDSKTFVTRRGNLVHVICLDCKTMIHFDDASHWNYKGKTKCPKCGENFMLEIKDGEVIMITHSHSHDR